MPPGVPARHRKADRDEHQQQEVAQQIGEVDRDRRSVPAIGAVQRRIDESRSDRSHRQAHDKPIEPYREADVAEVGAHEQHQAHIDQRVHRQVERVGDRGVRRSGHVVEP